MICKMCGRNTVNDNANFCEYCGNSFRENGPKTTEYNSGINQTMYNNQVDQNQNQEKPISFGNWLLIMLIPFIPFVGFIAYPALMLIWAFRKDTPPTKKNWARANLVIILIGIVIFIMFFESAMNMIMSGDFASYMKEFYNIDKFY